MAKLSLNYAELLKQLEETKDSLEELKTFVKSRGLKISKIPGKTKVIFGSDADIAYFKNQWQKFKQEKLQSTLLITSDRFIDLSSSEIRSVIKEIEIPTPIGTFNLEHLYFDVDRQASQPIRDKVDRFNKAIVQYRDGISQYSTSPFIYAKLTSEFGQFTSNLQKALNDDELMEPNTVISKSLTGLSAYSATDNQSAMSSKFSNSATKDQTSISMLDYSPPNNRTIRIYSTTNSTNQMQIYNKNKKIQEIAELIKAFPQNTFYERLLHAHYEEIDEFGSQTQGITFKTIPLSELNVRPERIQADSSATKQTSSTLAITYIHPLENKNYRKYSDHDGKEDSSLFVLNLNNITLAYMQRVKNLIDFKQIEHEWKLLSDFYSQIDPLVENRNNAFLNDRTSYPSTAPLDAPSLQEKLLCEQVKVYGRQNPANNGVPRFQTKLDFRIATVDTILKTSVYVLGYFNNKGNAYVLILDDKKPQQGQATTYEVSRQLQIDNKLELPPHTEVTVHLAGQSNQSPPAAEKSPHRKR